MTLGEMQRLLGEAMMLAEERRISLEQAQQELSTLKASAVQSAPEGQA